MAEVSCGSCGALSSAGARFCPICGQSLTSNEQAVVSPGQPSIPFAPVPTAVPAAPLAPPQFPPPSGPAAAPPPWPVTGAYGAPPAGSNAAAPTATGAVRPFGIVILAVVEIVIGLVGLAVALDLLRWSAYGFYYGDASEIVVDLTMALAYSAASIVGFGVARGLWSIQPWAWMRACLLSLALVGLIVFSVLPWGVDTLDIIGIAAHLSVLAYLNTNSVRGLFGQPPTTFLQGLLG